MKCLQQKVFFFLYGDILKIKNNRHIKILSLPLKADSKIGNLGFFSEVLRITLQDKEQRRIWPYLWSMILEVPSWVAQFKEQKSITRGLTGKSQDHENRVLGSNRGFLISCNLALFLGNQYKSGLENAHWQFPNDHFIGALYSWEK